MSGLCVTPIQKTLNPGMHVNLEEFSLDDVELVAGGDQEMIVLKEINNLREFENDNWSRGVCEIDIGVIAG